MGEVERVPMSDNFVVKVEGVLSHLDLALTLALANCNTCDGTDIWGYAILPNNSGDANDCSEKMLLFDREHEKATPFPVFLNGPIVAPLVMEWPIQTYYGPDPKDDNEALLTSRKGFSLLSTGLHVSGRIAEFADIFYIEIRPCWMLFFNGGKGKAADE
jgi:hypothetical protein